MKTHSGYLRAGEDKSPVSLRRHRSVGVTLCEEAVLAALDIISEAFSERAGDGLTLFRYEDFHNSIPVKTTLKPR